jgi:nuclease S1
MRRDGRTGEGKVCDGFRGKQVGRFRALRRLALAGALVGVLGMTDDALPLGANGHRIVARIAQNHLTDRARTRAIGLLDGDDLARIASWADDYRGTPDGRRTATWHYTTLPEGQSYTYTPADGNTDIGEAIRDQEAVLSDVGRPRTERVQALKFLIHFLGDVHQPMHVGRDGDRGGNDIQVQWFGGRTNLHRVWDSAILDHHRLSYTEWVEFLDRVTAEDVSQWQADPIAVWMAESQELREIAYAAMDSGAGPGDVPSLSWDYSNEMTPHLERRLVRAGIRLAGVLNRALGS